MGERESRGTPVPCAELLCGSWGWGHAGALLPTGMHLADGLLCTQFHQHGLAHGNFANLPLCFIPTDRRLSPDEPSSGSESQLCSDRVFFLPRKCCGVVENTSFSRLVSSSPLANGLRLQCNMIFLLKRSDLLPSNSRHTWKSCTKRKYF